MHDAVLTRLALEAGLAQAVAQRQFTVVYQPSLNLQSQRITGKALVRWQEQYPSQPPLSMAVNLSVRQLQGWAIVDEVAEALRDSGLPPETLMLEITESVSASGPSATRRR
jgi:EAL domain-containing protein (putative c-di-GMP-specific phosphodiesterase class I)